jgi:hypothetical protein
MNNTRLIYVFCFILSFLPASACSAVAADANIVKQLRTIKASKIEQSKSELASLKDQFRKVRFAPSSAYPTRDMRQKKLNNLQRQIDSINHTLAQLEANDINEIVPVFDLPFSIGQLGRLGTINLNVPSPGGQTPFISETYKGHPNPHPRKYNFNQFFKIISIVDGNNAIAELFFAAYLKKLPGWLSYDVIPYNSSIVWLRGVSTDGLVSGSSIRPPGLFTISGTEDYFTPIGAKQTVFVFEPLVIDTNNL